MIGLEMFIGFSKRAIESETLDNRPEKLQQLGTFMKVPNMNHCTADARRAFPVLLREPLGRAGTAWAAEGGEGGV